MTVSNSAAGTAPHSAAPAEQALSGEGQGATRARAREATPNSAQSAAQSTAQFPDTRSDRIGELWTRWAAWITPPDIVSRDRPALGKIRAYARSGEWTRPAGVPRRAGQAYAAAVAVPVTACCYWLAWIIERPARLPEASGDQAAWKRWVVWVTPPDIGRADRPGLAKVRAAARERWSRAGRPRRAGRFYATAVAVPVTACCYWLAWIIERPARVVAAGVLAVQLAQFPPLSWLIELI